jgi:hypothetical protein
MLIKQVKVTGISKRMETVDEANKILKSISAENVVSVDIKQLVIDYNSKLFMAIIVILEESKP